MTNKVKELIGRITKKIKYSDRIIFADTVNLLENCKAELERLQKENEWHPIETAPKDGSLILALGRGNFYVIVSWCNQRDLWVEDDCENNVYSLSFKGSAFTHWRPLPQPPEGGLICLNIKV